MLVDFVPGVVNQLSRRRNQANWRETNLMRWENGTLLPVGGWDLFTAGPFASPIRKIHRWDDNNGRTHTAFLCEEHCYVMRDEEFLNITPVGGISPPGSLGVGGYGNSDYGTEAYSTTRPAFARPGKASPTYSLDNWGQELRAMTSSDGRLLRWDPTASGMKLEQVSNAPSGRTFAITPERHIIIFGAGGVDQQFVWSDQENDTNWTPSTTSKAGGFYVEPSSPILARHVTAGGTLMFTARTSYLIRSVGLPYVYAYNKITDCPPPISPAAIAETPTGPIWMATNGFWLYNGVTAEPLPCTLWDWVVSNMNLEQTRYSASALNIVAKFEVWFFFSAGEGSDRNNRVIIFNYKDNLWSMGHLERSTGLSFANDPHPVIASIDKVWRHEYGWEYHESGLPWAETHTLNLNGGATLSTIVQMLPEISGGRDAVGFRLIKRDNPTSGPEKVSELKSIRTNGYVDVRETARDFRLRVEMVANKRWSLGPTDIRVVARGQK